MASYYPHKQTVLIAIVCIVAVGGVFLYAKGNPSDQKTAQKDLTAPSVGATASEKRLASTTDWRLSFIDRASSTAQEKNTVSTQQEDLTLTDQFGRDFFARYIQLKQSNLIENQPFVTDTLNQSIYNAARSAEQPKTYALADISMIADPTAAHIRSYGNSIGSIFSTYGVDADPAVIANDAFEKGDMSLLRQIDPVVSSYENIASALKALPVPQPMASYHLDLLNAISGMAKIARDIGAVENDPMQTMVSVSAYGTVQGTLVASLKSMKSYFALVGVAFAPTEPGSLFSQIL